MNGLPEGPQTGPATSTSPAAVLTAAGSGSRLGAAVPKALVRLAGVPLVVHAATRLAEAGVTALVVTAPADHVAEIERVLAESADLPPRWRVVPGGPTRQASVAAGLAALPDDAGPIVLVHDAARALAPADLLRRVAGSVAEGHDAVVPVLPVNDTVIRVAPIVPDTGPARSAGTVDRRTLRTVQTPQGFRRDVLVRAHAVGAGRAADESTAASDDAGLVEALGLTVTLVDGDPRALKITTTHDLAVASLLLGEGA